jgi:Na+/proline symporter
VLYLLFAFIPMFVVTAAVMVMPETARPCSRTIRRRCCPRWSWRSMPLILQVAFFGALLSAIMSTASATLLAPAPPLWRTSCATCARHERCQDAQGHAHQRAGVHRAAC